MHESPMSNVADYLVREALKDGSEVTIRAMRPDDKERLVDAFLHLQPDTIRRRFFYAKRSLSDDELHWLAEIGRGNHMGLVATVSGDRDEVVIGEASYGISDDRTAEVGFTVAEPWQRRGLGRRLLQHLADIARDRGISRFEADVLPENAAMLAVFRESGFPMATRTDGGTVRVTLSLDSRAPH